ncbi:MAG: hypothetical protein RLZZ175_2090 [Bacteroidota bacterium]
MRIKTLHIFIALLCLISLCLKAQHVKHGVFTHEDSLLGSNSSMRTCFDVLTYDLNLRINPSEKYIEGYNEIVFKSIEDFDKFQIDLHANLQIDSITYKGKRLPYQRDANSVFVYFNNKFLKGTQSSIKFYYSGKPKESTNPPWDGGFVWAKDSLNNDFVGVACEGIGANLWWPCKDQLLDEPDSMKINIECPVNLYCVSNGVISKRRDLDDGYARHEWKVNYPINNYDVTINIGRYGIISEKYRSLDGDSLQLNYYVLKYNTDKAKKQFAQVHKILQCYEKFYGKYPFWKDGFALVEAPFWGMEHQAAIAYGNKYQNNNFGFDYIIVHESAHEYWGNSITVKDYGDLWIHEAFATYSEVLFVEQTQGKALALKYLETLKEKIRNKEPIQGPLNVNYHNWSDADMYYKGAWMLHTIRNVIDNDMLFFSILYGITREYKLKNVDSKTIIDYFNKKTVLDLNNIFEQYLTGIEPPTLVYKLKQKKNNVLVKYKWKASKKWFKMPLRISFGENIDFKISPSTNWSTDVYRDQDIDNFKIRSDLFYVNTERIR